MAHAPAPPSPPPAGPPEDRGSMVRPTVQAPPVSPGKVAMWLFLATEVMFFTGLIGSYVVLRSGSHPQSYSTLYPPATRLEGLEGKRGVVVESIGGDEARVRALVAAAIRRPEGETPAEAEARASGLLAPVPHAVIAPLDSEAAARLARELESAGARAEVAANRTTAWPEPYDAFTNPLSIDLTAVNTFILICSSVTMVLALSAIQRGDQRKLRLYLLATLLIGGTFLGVQVYEYRALMFDHHYPPGVSASGHFRPDSSLFASCFFMTTGFHGAHVAGGLIALSCILAASLTGRYTRENHSSVELVGLYWHFVDLVWIILFTVIYLI